VLNGLIYGSDTFIKPSELPEDKRKLAIITMALNGKI
jgi:hypothetical protein